MYVSRNSKKLWTLGICFTYFLFFYFFFIDKRMYIKREEETPKICPQSIQEVYKNSPKSHSEGERIETHHLPLLRA